MLKIVVLCLVLGMLDAVMTPPPNRSYVPPWSKLPKGFQTAILSYVQGQKYNLGAISLYNVKDKIIDVRYNAYQINGAQQIVSFMLKNKKFAFLLSFIIFFLFIFQFYMCGLTFTFEANFENVKPAYPAKCVRVGSKPLSG